MRGNFCGPGGLSSNHEMRRFYQCHLRINSGCRCNFSSGKVRRQPQPIDLYVSQMLTSVRAAVAVKRSGGDLAVLEKKAKAIEELMSAILGNADVMRVPRNSLSG